MNEYIKDFLFFSLILWIGDGNVKNRLSFIGAKSGISLGPKSHGIAFEKRGFGHKGGLGGITLNNRKFKIKNNKEFDIILNISSYIKSYRYGKDPSFELSLLVNGKKEYITLKLSPFNNQIFNSLNSYAYDSFENNWYPFDKIDKHDRYSCVVTPFSCTLKQIKMKFNFNFKNLT